MRALIKIPVCTSVITYPLRKVKINLLLKADTVFFLVNLSGIFFCSEFNSNLIQPILLNLVPLSNEKKFSVKPFFTLKIYNEILPFTIKPTISLTPALLIDTFSA